MSAALLALSLDFALEEPRFAWGAVVLVALLMLLALVRRPKKLAMPSLALWNQAVAGSFLNRALPLFRAVRAVLTGIAILLAGLLCARPLEALRGPLDWLIVLDASPSMDAREADGRTRLELAREAARRFVLALPPSDRVDLLIAADPPRLGCASGSARDLVLQALERIETEAPPADLAGALEIAASAARVPVVLSDGAGQRGAGPRPSAGLSFGVGDVRANRAFVDLELDAAWPAPARITWKIESSGGAALPLVLELVDPLGRSTSVPCDASSGSVSGPSSAELPHWAGGTWTLRMNEGDALPFDDAVRFHLDGLAPRGVALRGPSSRSVHPALAVAFELAAQSFEVPLRWLAPDEFPRADEVLVQDGGTLRPSELPRAGALLFGTAVEGWLEAESAGAESSGAAIVRIESALPSLSGLPLDRLRVRRASARPLPNRAFETWIAGPDRPLLYAARIEGARVLGTTFELHESNAPAEASFAVLAHRLLLELAQPDVRAPAFLHAGARAEPWMRSATDDVAGGALLMPWPDAPLRLPAVLPREGTLEIQGATVPIELLDADSSAIAPGWAPGWVGTEPPRPLEPRPLSSFVASLLLLVLIARAVLDLLAAA